MSRRFIVRDRAQIDMDEAEAYYESVRVGLGETYLQAVQSTFERIEWMPEM